MIAQPINDLLERLHADALRKLDLERSAMQGGCVNGSWPVGMLAQDALILVEYVRVLDRHLDTCKAALGIDKTGEI